MGHYKQFMQEHREDFLKREGCLCHLCRKREGLDGKVLLDLSCSFGIAWKTFQFVEKQPTPVWDHQTQNLAVRNCIGCLWSGSKVLAAAGALVESPEVRVSEGEVCPHTAFAFWKQAQEYGPESSRNVTICHVKPLGKEQEWLGKLF